MSSIQQDTLNAILRYQADKKLGESEMAAELEITPSNWSAWKKRKAVSSEGLAWIIANRPDLLPPQSVHFAGTKGGYKPPGSVPTPSFGVADEDPNQYVTKVEGARLSAGSGQIAFVHEEIDGSHAFKRSWLRSRGISNVERCRILEVTGASMSPSLEEGDVVLVNPDDTDVKSGRVYALLVDDELKVKRLHKRPGGGLEITSDNPAPQYRSETVAPDAMKYVKVVGRVIWRSGEL